MENIENTTVVEQIAQEQINETPEVNVDNIKAGKIKFAELSPAERGKVSRELYETLSDEEKEDWNLGHRPKEVFLGVNKDGTPKEWVSREEFRRRINDNAPIKNERIRELTKNKDEGRQRELDLQSQVKKLIELNKAKFERDLMTEEMRIKEEENIARENNDIDHYDKIINRKNLLEREKLTLKSFEEPPKLPIAPDPVSGLKPEAAEWVARNQEIVNDPMMLQYAKIKDQEMAFLYPDRSLKERLQLVEEEVKSKYSDRFPDAKISTRTVESGRNNVAFASKPKTKTFSDLPELERQQAAYLIKRGIFKNEADFLKTYEWK